MKGQRLPQQDKPQQPNLEHEILTQAEQAKHLGVKQERLMNLGHPCLVQDIAKHPLGSHIDEYTQGPAKRALTESDRPGHGVFGSFADAQSGFSTNENLKSWSGYASANSQVGPGTMKQPKDAKPDKRELFPEPRDGSGTTNHKSLRRP